MAEPHWRSRARCKGLGPQLFYGTADESPHDRIRREASARLFCSGCEVNQWCLSEADNEEGIWGGKTESERRNAMHRARPTREHYLVNVPVNPTPDNDSPWTALESCANVVLFRRDSANVWHGSEFLVLKDGIVYTVTDDLSDAYTAYHRLLG